MPRFQVWRAMTELPGYVCLAKQKRECVRQIVRGVDEFTHRVPRENWSCMLKSAPGSGKTRLIHELANRFKLNFLQFNITQMISRQDLLDCFDKIVTTQANEPQKDVMVFIDEINALLTGQPVYDAFLAPLQDQNYVRADKKFHIAPSVWVFAGTDRPSDQTRSGDVTAKLSDLESRLTLKSIELRRGRGSPGDEQANRLENVYLGVALLCNAFPDVRFVSNRVLEFFHSLPEVGYEVRDLEHVIHSFANIRYGRVRLNNISLEQIEKIEKDCKNRNLPIELVSFKQHRGEDSGMDDVVIDW